jgi:hypothetical protein
MILILLSSACRTATETITETATESSSDIEVFLTDTQERVMSREVIPLNNCNGTEPFVYTRTYSLPPSENTLEIFSDSAPVEQLAKALDTSNISPTNTIQLSTPARTKVEYTIAVYGKFRAGYAQIKGLAKPVYFEYEEDQRIVTEAAIQATCGQQVQVTEEDQSIVTETATQATVEQQIQVKVEHKNEPTKKRAVGAPITFPQPNCGGTTEATNYVGLEHTISYTAELGGQVSVSASGSVGIPTIGEVGIGTEIAQIYSKIYGAEETLVRGITVGAAPGTNMLHTYQLIEYFESGDVFILSDDKVIESYPYSFTTDFQVELVNSEDLGCNGN